MFALLLAQVSATTITLDPFIVALIGGTLIPIVTGLVTKLEASSGVKAGVALVLSAVVGVLGSIVSSNGTFDWKIAVLAAGAAFATNVTTYLGVHKAIGSTGAPLGATATAGFGLGSPAPKP